jgi:hypothetical protein
MTERQKFLICLNATDAANHDDDFGETRTEARGEWWAGQMAFDIGLEDEEATQVFVVAYLHAPKNCWSNAT